MGRSYILSVRLTPEQVAWLERVAEEVKESVSWVIRDAIDQARREDEDA